jgi:hypothetical protein
MAAATTLLAAMIGYHLSGTLGMCIGGAIETHPRQVGSVVRAVVIFMMLACAAGCSPVPEPIVDKTGVDEGRYSRDLADCYQHMPSFAFGNPVTTCMRGKGYNVLYGR